jgi:hypothetical protein
MDFGRHAIGTVPSDELLNDVGFTPQPVFTQFRKNSAAEGTKFSKVFGIVLVNYYMKTTDRKNSILHSHQ